jgi:glycosyltransferase involved in cell wall biosynthesis
MIYLGPSDSVHQISDKQKLLSVRKKYNLPDKFILNTGDINWNKNIPGLVNACQNLHVPLVLVGRQAPLVEKMDTNHPELRHLSELKSVFAAHKSDILRLGFIPDADYAAVCSLATVYCQPSFAEGFGLSVLHALACGTPVACSRTHSLPEIAGSCAVYFDPYSQQSIEKALSDLMADTGLRKQLSKAGLEQAKKFSWEKTARETVSVYHQVINHEN